MTIFFKKCVTKSLETVHLSVLLYCAARLREAQVRAEQEASLRAHQPRHLPAGHWLHQRGRLHPLQVAGNEQITAILKTTTFIIISEPQQYLCCRVQIPTDTYINFKFDKKNGCMQ